MDDKPIQASIAIADGYHFIRTASKLFCIGNYALVLSDKILTKPLYPAFRKRKMGWTFIPAQPIFYFF